MATDNHGIRSEMLADVDNEKGVGEKGDTPYIAPDLSNSASAKYVKLH